MNGTESTLFSHTSDLVKSQLSRLGVGWRLPFHLPISLPLAILYLPPPLPHPFYHHSTIKAHVGEAYCEARGLTRFGYSAGVRFNFFLSFFFFFLPSFFPLLSHFSFTLFPLSHPRPARSLSSILFTWQKASCRRKWK